MFMLYFVLLFMLWKFIGGSFFGSLVSGGFEDLAGRKPLKNSGFF
jgi:hypothetical protein